MKIRTIVIHCSATPPYRDIGVAEIDEWHRERGWKKIGYHLVIRRDGSLEYGREADRMGAHAKGHNKDSYAICWIGGVDNLNRAEDNRTDAQKASLETAVKAIKLIWPNAAVIGHNEVSTKDCPSFDCQEWLESLA